MSSPDHPAGLVLGPLQGARRIQLRRLLGYIAGVRVVAQAFSLQQVGPLIEAHQASVLLLSSPQDLQALGPLPACVRACLWLGDGDPGPAPPGLKLRGLPCPADLEQVRVGDAFFQALSTALGASHGPAAAGAAPAAVAPLVAAPQASAGAGVFQMLAVGASTGGPDALAGLLQPLAGRLPVPVVVTQHIGTGFSMALAQSLSQRCGLPVHEAFDGQWLQSGHIYLAPADRHLLVRPQQGQWLARLDDGPPECFCKPSVDTMLRSLAASGGPRTLVVILTGMGQDGLAGARLICQKGGRILAQDQASSVVWGMPGAVAGAGLCDAVLSPPALAQKVLRMLGASA